VRHPAPATRGLSRALVALLLVTTILPVTSVAAAGRQVPFGFLGVMVDGAMLEPGVSLNEEFGQMVSTGVESVRIGVYWSVTQPYRNAAAVPTGQASQYPAQDGIPTDWSATDALYLAAASHGLRVLPVILQAPVWARKDPQQEWSPPASPAAFGHFAGLVAQRYGPHGAFWSEHPGLRYDPSTQWQIWNEPAGGTTPNGVSLFWPESEPFQVPYIAMLRAAGTAIRAADPHAEIILAGLFGRGWLALQSLYKHGARGLFNAVAINIFTRYPKDVILALKLTRTVMDQNGDGNVPLLATEFSWPSALGHVPEASDRSYGYDTTTSGQAQNLTTELGLMAAQRTTLKLQQVFWYTWLSRDAAKDSSFEYAGLRHIDETTLKITPKPAQAAYRAAARSLEGCVKAQLAVCKS
jgi:hypothetical protein